MRVYTKLVLSIESGAVVKRESYEYSGPLAECVSGSGGKTKSKQQSQSTSDSESGTKYNQDFIDKATAFARGRPSYDNSPENFDAAAYLKAHPELANSQYGQDPMNTDRGLYQHWANVGQNDKTGKYAFTPKAGVTDPTYDPQYVKSAYTGANFTSVAPEGFQKLESSLYDTQQSKLKQAYDQATAQQREELAQSGALNSPSQYLEGSARSSLDRSYISNLQQAARDAFQGRLGAETGEAARKSTFDLAQAQNRTAFDTGEATRETGFNERTASQLLDLWLKKLGVAIEAGRYSKGQSQSTASGSSSGLQGSGGIFQFGGSSSSGG